MLVSEKLAIAAHLHVLLRRKTGRVTDTEWMALNLEYAQEIVRFSRQHAKEDNLPDLAEWAGKLEAALGLNPEPSKAAARRIAGPSSQFPESGGGGAEGEEAQRYIRGIR
jgi:hypothetical protein